MPDTCTAPNCNGPVGCGCQISLRADDRLNPDTSPTNLLKVQTALQRNLKALNRTSFQLHIGADNRVFSPEEKRVYWALRAIRSTLEELLAEGIDPLG